jgi:TatD DNase family protein
MLIDSHAHLEMKEFDRDRDEVVERARQAGIEAIVTVGTNLDDCVKAVSLAERYREVYAAVGIHPHDVKEINDKTYGLLKELAGHEKVVAYGEIGLDFYRDRSPRDTQIRCFGEQLDVAAELGLPVIIHDREAHEQTVRMLKARKDIKGGIIHCFSGDAAMARECLDMGFFISIPGPVTYPKAIKITDVVKYVPLERLLVETDCPYLTPNPHRGGRNEPAFVVHTAKRVAEIKKMPYEEVEKITSRNTKTVFNIQNL